MRHIFSFPLVLALLVGCSSRTPEEQVAHETAIKRYEENALSVLSRKAAEGQCYASVNLAWYDNDDSVAYAAAVLANQAKETWTLISYNQEFNSRRTAVYKLKSC